MRQRLVAFGILLALSACVIWWRQESTTMTERAPIYSGALAPAQEGSTTGSAAPEPLVSHPEALTLRAAAPAGPRLAELAALDASLPPEEAPLAQAQEALWAAARAGSAKASWRLLEASETCIQYAEARAMLADGRVDESSRVDIEKFLVLAEDFCAGTAADHRAALIEAMRLGVEAADVRVMTAYLLNPPIPREFSIRLADELVSFRENAPRIAQWLLDQGYGEVSGYLALAYDGLSNEEVRYAPFPNKLQGKAPARPPTERVQSALGQALPDDPALAWRYARLCMQVGSDYQRPRCENIARANAKALNSSQRELLQAWVDQRRKLDGDKVLPRRLRTNLAYSL